MKPLSTSTHHTEWFCSKDCSTGCTARHIPSLESWTDDYGGDGGGDDGGDDDGDDGGDDDGNLKRKLIMLEMMVLNITFLSWYPDVVMVMSIMVAVMLMKCDCKNLNTKLIMLVK